MATAAEIAAVDTFLEGRKHLFGSPPEFGPTTYVRRSQAEWQAVWPIADDLGVVTTGQMRIVARPGPALGPSIAIIFNGQCVSRLDMVPQAECEPNPHWAAALGMPPMVCGPHFHGWEQNRGFLLDSEGWRLPAREPLPPQVRRFSQAFPWLADRINLVLTPEQRAFEVPAYLV